MPNDSQHQVIALSDFIDDIKYLAKRYRHVREDIQPLIDRLRSGETPGDRIPGIGQVVYKERVRNRDARRGKSGGYRVIYQVKGQQIILLVTIYSKTDQEGISPDVIADIIKQNL